MSLEDSRVDKPEMGKNAHFSQHVLQVYGFI